jgi:hypothetical protein
MAVSAALLAAVCPCSVIEVEGREKLLQASPLDGLSLVSRVMEAFLSINERHQRPSVSGSVWTSCSCNIFRRGRAVMRLKFQPSFPSWRRSMVELKRNSWSLTSSGWTKHFQRTFWCSWISVNRQVPKALSSGPSISGYECGGWSVR